MDVENLISTIPPNPLTISIKKEKVEEKYLEEEKSTNPIDQSRVEKKSENIILLNNVT